MTSPADFLAAAAATALAGAGTYLRESPVQATLDINNQPPPFIVCGDYTTTQAGPESRTESVGVTLYFADAKPGRGDDPVAHLDAVTRMEGLKRRFLAALDASPLVMLSGLKATPFADAYEAMLDGVGCQFTLTVPALALC